MFENYKNEIKKQFIHVKQNDITGFFDNISPAECRDRFLLLYDDEKLSEDDKSVIRLFLETKEEENLRKSINNSKIDKFRPIISFLKGEKNSRHKVRINIAAILVDFNPRPFARYKDQPKKNVENNPLLTLKNDNEKINGFADIENSPITTTKIKSENPNPKKPNWIKKNIRSIILGSTLCMGILLGINHFTSEKEWMEWINDHYEAIDWDGKSDKGNRIIIPRNDYFIQNLRKIIPCDTTKYERNGRTCLWYEKSLTSKHEFFTAPGLHPENGKTLKKVTNHIMKNYGRGPCE